MNGLDGWLQIAAALAYLIASVGYGAHLLLRQDALANYGRVAAVAGVVFHSAAIGVHCAVTKQTPFTTPAEMLSAGAWAVALAYLILDLLRRPRPTALGAFALPAAFLCLFAGAALDRTSPAETNAAVAQMLASRVVSLHILAIVFAFALLVLAFGCAAFYLVQHRLLKGRRVAGGLWGKLPPLASLDHLAFTLVAFAFPLLTVGLLAGIIRAATGGLPSGWLADSKILASIVTWLVYGIYLGLHIGGGWRGPRANYLLLGGLLVALVTYFVPTSAHRFG